MQVYILCNVAERNSVTMGATFYYVCSGIDRHRGSAAQDTLMHELNEGSTAATTITRFPQRPGLVQRLQTTVQFAQPRGPAEWKKLLKSGTAMGEDRQPCGGV